MKSGARGNCPRVCSARSSFDSSTLMPGKEKGTEHRKLDAQPLCYSESEVIFRFRSHQGPGGGVKAEGIGLSVATPNCLALRMHGQLLKMYQDPSPGR